MDKRLNGLVEFLNAAFKASGGGYRAVSDTENGCVTVKYGNTDAIEYEIYPVADSVKWELFGMVCIAGDRDTPDDYDVESIAVCDNVPDAFRKLTLHTVNNNIDRWIESASIALNPDFDALF